MIQKIGSGLRRALQASALKVIMSYQLTEVPNRDSFPNLHSDVTGVRTGDGQLGYIMKNSDGLSRLALRLIPTPGEKPQWELHAKVDYFSLAHHPEEGFPVTVFGKGFYNGSYELEKKANSVIERLRKKRPPQNPKRFVPLDICWGPICFNAFDTIKTDPINNYTYIGGNDMGLLLPCTNFPLVDPSLGPSAYLRAIQTIEDNERNRMVVRIEETGDMQIIEEGEETPDRENQGSKLLYLPNRGK